MLRDYNGTAISSSRDDDHGGSCSQERIRSSSLQFLLYRSQAKYMRVIGDYSKAIRLLAFLLSDEHTPPPNEVCIRI